MIVHENDWNWGHVTTICMAHGKAMCRVSFDKDYPEQSSLGGLIVHPSIQGRGYGNKLLKAAIKVAKKRGAKELWLQADGWRVGWYRRHGFIGDWQDEEGMFEMTLTF